MIPNPAAFYAGSGRLQVDVVGLSLPPVTAEQCAFLAGELERNGCPLPPADGAAPAERYCALVLAAHAALLREAGFFCPVGAEPAAHQPGGAEAAVVVPRIVCGPELASELVAPLARLCTQTALHAAPAASWIGELRQQIAKVPLPFLAAAQMVRAAYDLEMPILEWHSVFAQVGYGRNAVALSGSITEHTPSIGVHLAREKAKANALLARAGFPIAEGGLVKDWADARARAEVLGYPVVVKPADRDGGDAVSSDIRDPAELEQAFARARAASAKVMVEKHVEGVDHRVLFFRDELIIVLERTPGGVTGNGKDTVARLLERLNAQPERGDGPGALLHKIAFDAEARLMLARQGLSETSVPAKGRFVPLRRAANHALGGTVRRVDDVHPDNIDLARRAMRLLRLDLAGLDLILPDATRSWRETGGAICEVNAQPYIGEVYIRDLYQEILKQLIPGGGRIPVVLVVGRLDRKTLAALEKRVPGLAVIDADGARRDGRPLSVAGLAWPHACQAALYDQQTAAALCLLDPGQDISELSPADRFSAAFVLDALPEAAEPLLRRADALFALDPPKRKGLKFKAIVKADIAKALAEALEATPAKPRRAAPKAKPVRRGTAPPARRKRR